MKISRRGFLWGFAGPFLAPATTRLERVAVLGANQERGFIPGEALVKLPEGMASFPFPVVSIRKLLDEPVRSEKLHAIGADRVYHVVFQEPVIGNQIEARVEARTFEGLSRELGRRSIGVERNGIAESEELPVGSSGEPDDPEYPRQWHHGFIRANKVWPAVPVAAEGREKVVFCMVDSGYAAHVDHPPLDARSKSLIDSTPYLRTSEAQSDHATMASGVACAVRGNSIGITGVAGNCQSILLVKAMRITLNSGVARGFGEMADIIAAYYYLLNNVSEKMVVSNSYSSFFGSELLFEAIKAGRQRMLVAAAAGNYGTDQRRFPAGYALELDNVICVVGLADTGQLYASTSFGPHGTFGAPGERICSTTFLDRYRCGSGTSFATPVAAGAIKLIWEAAEQKRLDLPAWRVKQISTESARLSPELQGLEPNLALDALNVWQKVSALRRP